jgi:hypothetical protein
VTKLTNEFTSYNVPALRSCIAGIFLFGDWTRLAAALRDRGQSGIATLVPLASFILRVVSLSSSATGNESRAPWRVT